ncbi:MAG: ATPase domain-containing protein [Bdellovibrionia bacterium]
MNTAYAIGRIETGVRNLDALLHGGLPKDSVTVFGGPPGAGKTVLTQQLCFHNASPKSRVLFVQTLSEPTAKTLKYAAQFSFFDAKKIEDGSVSFVDIGVLMRYKGLEPAFSLLASEFRRVKPALVAIDSFKVFSDLARSQEELRKFTYNIVIQLMAWECTAFLLGEFSLQELESNPVSSVVDGIIMLHSQEFLGEQQRFIQIIKMRGTDHDRDRHPFAIRDKGIEIYAPKATIRRGPDLRSKKEERSGRCKLGIPGLDDILGEGISRGSSVLISGASGTGKTLLSLEALYQGAKIFGEKGVFFSFEETNERLRTTAHDLGWDLEGEIRRGMMEIVFIPQPDILVERDLLRMHESIKRLKAERIAIDSLSVFLHKMTVSQFAREKAFQLATIVQSTHAVGFFTNDIPYGTHQISRFGVEETVMDGIILLSANEEGLNRQRYLEVYKLRNTSHILGRHKMILGNRGLIVDSGENFKKKSKFKKVS